MARESDRDGNQTHLGRRAFVAGSAAVLAWPAHVFAKDAAPTGAASLSPQILGELENSGLVYVSPLRSDGSESKCHGEIWFGWIDGSVVVNTATKTWKARAVAAGLDGARIWVGDHGRWNTLGFKSEQFKKAPHFDATARASTDAALNGRLLAIYDEKYPDGIGKYRDRMADLTTGERTLVVYTPA